MKNSGSVAVALLMTILTMSITLTSPIAKDFSPKKQSEHNTPAAGGIDLSVLMKWQVEVHGDETASAKIDRADAAKHLYLVKLVLADVLAAKNREASSVAFFPRINEESMVAHLDCAIDYECSCDTRFRYMMVPAASGRILYAPIFDIMTSDLDPNGSFKDIKTEDDLIDKVRTLQDSALYQVYDKRNQFENFQIERHARFLRRLSAKQVAELQIELGSLVPSGEHLEELWVEGSVRVNSKGEPVEPASKDIRPVALVTDKGMYFALELMYLGPDIKCALGNAYKGNAFDISQCQTTDCAKLAINTFALEIEKELAKAPILATPSHEDIPPGELWYSREYKDSKVLGEPYFENAQYILKWWRNESGMLSPPEMYVYSKGNTSSPGSFLFVQLLQSINVSVGVKGKYEEVANTQLAGYKDALSLAMKRAIGNSCVTLKGSVQNDICVLGLENSKLR